MLDDVRQGLRHRTQCRFAKRERYDNLRYANSIRSSLGKAKPHGVAQYLDPFDAAITSFRLVLKLNVMDIEAALPHYIVDVALNQ